MNQNNWDVLMNVKAILFDLDGTLINSEKAFCKSFKSVLYDYFHIVVTNEDYKRYELEQNAMLLKTLKNKYEILLNFSNQDIMELVYQNYESEFKKIIMEPVAQENFKLLWKLKEAGLLLALVTTCRRYYLEILINKLKLDDLFDVISAREDVEHLKPAPDAYNKAIHQLDVDPLSCLAVEDSKRGISAGINSGIPVMQVHNFNSIQFTDNRAISCNSANELMTKVLEKRYHV